MSLSSVPNSFQTECPTCAWGSLDLSQGLFSSFTSLDAGVFQMTWWFNGGSNSGGGQAQPTTTQWVDPAPWTTNYTPPATTSTPVYVPPTTTAYTPPATTTTYAPAPAPTTDDTNTIQDVPSSSNPTPSNNVPMMNAAVVQLAQLINAANPH